MLGPGHNGGVFLQVPSSNVIHSIFTAPLSKLKLPHPRAQGSGPEGEVDPGAGHSTVRPGIGACQLLRASWLDFWAL